MKQREAPSIVVGIHCIYIPVTNIKKSADWYVNNLHLTLIRAVDETSNHAQLKIASEQAIFLIKTKEQMNLNYQEIDGNEQCFLTIEVANIHKLHQQLVNNGVDVSGIQDNGDCGLNLYIKDPDGNLIDIWER